MSPRHFIALVATIASVASCRALLSIEEKTLVDDAVTNDASEEGDGMATPDVAVDAPTDGCSNVCGSPCVDFANNTSHCGYCNHGCKACEVGRCAGEIAQELGGAFVSLVRGNQDLYVGTTNTQFGRVRRFKGGSVLTLASDLGDGARMVLREPWVYFVAPAVGRVARVKIDGMETTELASGEVGAAFLALGGDTLYFNNANGEIRRVASAGGTPSEPFLDNLGTTSWIVVDTTHVFYVVTTGPSRGLWRSDLAGNIKAKLYGGTVTALAEQNGKIFVADATTNLVLAVSKGDGTKTPLADQQLGLGGLDVDATHVWFTTNDGVVHRAPLLGGATQAVAFTTIPNPPIVIASDPNVILWHAGPKVFSAPK